MRLTGSSEDQVLDEVWAYLTPEEATLLYQSLAYWFDEDSDPGWHHHVGGNGAPELTLAIEGRPQ